jgi:hypothetical protein
MLNALSKIFLKRRARVFSAHVKQRPRKTTAQKQRKNMDAYFKRANQNNNCLYPHIHTVRT